MKKKTTTIIVVMILIIAAFFRLWLAPELFHFGIDEEYQSHLAWSLVKDFHIIWIGVNAANLGYYLGPGFTYLNAFFFWISKGDPIILSYVAAIMGIVTTASVYFVTHELFNKKAALIASFIYASSALMAFYDRRFWNPSLIPFIAIWLIYSLVKAQKDTRWLILSAFLLACSYHVHLSLLVFWLPFLATLIQYRTHTNWKTWGLMIVAYFAVTSPLLVYDFVHNFDNLKLPLTILNKTTGDESSIQVITHLKDLFSTLGRIWFIKPFSNVVDEVVPGMALLKTSGNLLFSTFSLALLICMFRLKKAENKLILGSIVLFILAYLLYPGVVHEYYLLGFFPLFIVNSSVLLAKLNTKLLILLGVVMIIMNFNSLVTFDTKTGLVAKRELIKKTFSYVKTSSYSLETQGSYRAFAGWRYLFKTYGSTPTTSSADEFFGWIYPDEISADKPKFKVIVTDNPKPASNLKPVYMTQSGNYYSFVYLNP